MTHSSHPFIARAARLGLLLMTVNTALAAVQFRALSWQGDITDVLFKSDGREVALIANDNALSAPYHFAGEGPLELYRIVNIDGQPVRRSIATIPIPPNLPRAILILAVTPEGACSGRWLDNTADTTPAGMMRIHNLSTKEVAVAIGTGQDIRTLTSGGSAGIKFPENARTLPIRVAMRTEDRWAVALSIAQPVRAHLRFMAIVRDGRPTPDEPERALDWVSFLELPPPPSDLK